MAGEAKKKNNLTVTAAEKFLAIFPSNEESFVVRRSVAADPDADGKCKGEYSTYSIDSEKRHLRRRLTAADIDSHLRGKACLVLKPERKDGTCLWAMSDFDVYRNENEIKRIMATADHERLPFVFFTSKSGGLHGAVFFRTPVTAAKARMQLNLYNHIVGHPGAEIFPKPVAADKKPFGIAMPLFGEPERFETFTPNPIDLSDGNGDTPDYLIVQGRAPEGGENVELEDLTGPPGIPIPDGVDFEKLLDARGLKFQRRVEGNEVSLDYHGINSQHCLIQGTVHAANRTNPRCSRFIIRDGRVSHQCFDSDCRGVSGSRTAKALTVLGIDLGKGITTAKVANVEFKTGEVETESAATIITVPYPVEVWTGTLYGEYAELQTSGNFIPPEFFIESVKTVVGAIAGDRVSGNRDGANLRQFTVIVGVVGKGKGTAARHTTNEFRGSPQRADGASNDYLRAETAASAYRQIGAVLANSASEVGLYRSAKACPRILLTPTEFSEFLAKMKIENSALSSNVRELFDTTWFTPTTSAKREAKELPTRCMLSLLSTTQLSTLTTALATHGGLGEGLVSRLTFVYNDECRTVAALEEANLEDWRRRLFAKLLPLETGGQAFVFDPDAVKLLNEWWRAIQTGGEENEEIITRLNVITLRNALHFAWLRTEPDEPLSWRVDVEDMTKAIRLGDYQLAQRRFLVVSEAENPLACQQEKIRAYLRRHGPSTFREIRRGTHASRVGTEIHKRAMTGLAEGDEIVSKPTERKNSFRYHLAKDE